MERQGAAAPTCSAVPRPSPRRRRRDGSHHRGVPLHDLVRGCDVAESVTRFALEYLQRAHAASRYQVGDDAGTVVACSRAWLDHIGYDEGDALGRSCRQLQGPRTDPQAVARLGEALFAGFATAHTTSLVNYRKDGSAFENEFSILPLRDTRGAPVFFLSVHDDATLSARLPVPAVAPGSPKMVFRGLRRASERSGSSSSDPREDGSGASTRSGSSSPPRVGRRRDGRDHLGSSDGDSSDRDGGSGASDRSADGGGGDEDRSADGRSASERSADCRSASERSADGRSERKRSFDEHSDSESPSASPSASPRPRR
mmetsp:Transcript_10324/g.31811  ORF Transcript_10324/g.31811 Transcript_10324/m.31811 type:complete len:314 (+) Transcript_10324:156-1097(+)